MSKFVEIDDSQSFVDPIHFGQVRAQMKKHGLLEFSSVVINKSDSRPYHIPTTHARDTSMFFWKSQTAILVKLSYHEHSSRDEGYLTYGYWKLQAYVQLKPYQDLLDSTPPAEWDNIPFYNRNREIHAPDYGFYRTSGGMGDGSTLGYIMSFHFAREMSQGGDPTDPVKLADAVAEFVGQFDGLLGRLPFRELQVTDFPPYYTFPGCEEVFWSRFDMRNLRALVKRPWGSEGLRR